MMEPVCQTSLQGCRCFIVLAEGNKDEVTSTGVWGPDSFVPVRARLRELTGSRADLALAELFDYCRIVVSIHPCTLAVNPIASYQPPYKPNDNT